MAQDLRIVSRTPSGRLYGATWPRPDVIEGVENLTQRIFVNLSTEPGDDQFDPVWGSGLKLAMRGIPGQRVAEARRVATTVLQKCLTDIQRVMLGTTDPDEQLLALDLKDLQYDADSDSWLLTVDATTTGNLRFELQV